jgi:cytochrome c oxidase subunit 2
MRFRVIALEPKEFAEWVEQQKKPARTVAATPNAEPLHIQPASLEYRRNAPGWSQEFDLSPFENWKQKQFPEKDENPALIAQGRKLFQDKTCVSCHTIRGHEGMGTTAPDLTHVGARTTIAGGLLENNTANLRRWITDPNNVKPGNKMYVGVPMGGSVMPGYMVRDARNGHLTPNIKIDSSEAAALTAYLQSLK